MGGDRQLYSHGDALRQDGDEGGCGVPSLPILRGRAGDVHRGYANDCVSQGSADVPGPPPAPVEATEPPPGRPLPS